MGIKCKQNGMCWQIRVTELETFLHFHFIFHLFSSNLNFCNLLLTEPYLTDLILKIMKKNLGQMANEKR